MPVVTTTQEAEAGELLEPGEPRSCHCTPAWETQQDSASERKKKKRKKKRNMLAHATTWINFKTLC